MADWFSKVDRTVHERLDEIEHFLVHTHNDGEPIEKPAPVAPEEVVTPPSQAQIDAYFAQHAVAANPVVPADVVNPANPGTE